MNEDNKPNEAPVDSAPPQMTEDQEWTAANADFVLNQGINLNPAEGAKKDESTEQSKNGETAPAPNENKDDQKQDEGEGTGDDRKKEDESDKTEGSDALREARNVQRVVEEDRKAMVADIKEQLYSDIQTELTDADGDPIRTIEDVQKHLNPRTNKPFTDTEAAAWLLAAQQNLARESQTAEKEAEQIAEVNLDLRDQADATRSKWKSLLDQLDKEQPGFSSRLWQRYAKTLVVDEKTNIIKQAPVSMEAFYEDVLSGHAKAAELARAQADAEVKRQAEQQDVKRKEVRTDRSDIYATGKIDDIADDEDKEWAKAAKAVYER